MNLTDRKLTVTELNTVLNNTLQRAIPRVVFEGELSQVTRAASGHLYLTVKDQKSQIGCVMWKGLTNSLDFVPKQGLAVTCEGKPNFYVAGGRLQIVLDRMFEAGEGALQRKFLELKARLEKEGLFDSSRKRELPFFPRRVGVVTSKSGAVIHDIMVKIHERMPSTQVYLYDVPVQGEGAAAKIAAGIEYLNQKTDVDVIIVGRGGGSLEDLWPFNEEAVVRAVFSSKIPIISGVGHETDTALSDLAADKRAPTPTAAAEMVVPHREELGRLVEELERRLSDVERWLYPLSQQLDDLALRLETRVGHFFTTAKLKVESLAGKVQALSPERVVARMQNALNDLTQRLQSSTQRKFSLSRERVESLSLRLSFERGLERISRRQEQLATLQARFARGSRTSQQRRIDRFKQARRQLEAVSPVRVLERGYAIVRSGSQILREGATLARGDSLDISFSKGGVRAEVKEVLKAQPLFKKE